ncbi:hypothetical protein ONS95_010549 [Cadophora gregata]|uniref:uncharacterized protein n=1 Tax=Cadophora gregata TaxID=51156 RepID=UPI0026DC9A58|nr:uncharacterized protein ONS95_010549 [Cadophora gregata]KAK0122304.1 hypothetical protein ONS95_010549 [Cadophora gregata]KAK0127777.1 hypothetical protein ONS96_007288 [Cadophora gregata f. sp. sojae]
MDWFIINLKSRLQLRNDHSVEAIVALLPPQAIVRGSAPAMTNFMFARTRHLFIDFMSHCNTGLKTCDQLELQRSMPIDSQKQSPTLTSTVFCFSSPKPIFL